MTGEYGIPMKFKGAVEAVPHLRFRPGLRALRRCSDYISCEQPRKIIGSVGIEDDLKDKPGYRKCALWDFLIGFCSSKADRLYFVEVHPAASSNVAEMIKKLDWILRWLQSDAQPINRFPWKKFYWIATGGVKIPRHSPQYKRLRQTQIAGPVEQLILLE
jgi:hypothetical protein